MPAAGGIFLRSGRIPACISSEKSGTDGMSAVFSAIGSAVPAGGRLFCSVHSALVFSGEESGRSDSGKGGGSNFIPGGIPNEGTQNSGFFLPDESCKCVSFRDGLFQKNFSERHSEKNPDP